MKVSISTIKKNKVFLVLCLEKGVSKDTFSQTVQDYFLLNHSGIPYNFYAFLTIAMMLTLTFSRSATSL